MEVNVKNYIIIFLPLVIVSIVSCFFIFIYDKQKPELYPDEEISTLTEFTAFPKIQYAAMPKPNKNGITHELIPFLGDVISGDKNLKIEMKTSQKTKGIIFPEYPIANPLSQVKFLPANGKIKAKFYSPGFDEISHVGINLSSQNNRLKVGPKLEIGFTLEGKTTHKLENTRKVELDLLNFDYIKYLADLSVEDKRVYFINSLLVSDISHEEGIGFDISIDSKEDKNINFNNKSEINWKDKYQGAGIILGLTFQRITTGDSYESAVTNLKENKILRFKQGCYVGLGGKRKIIKEIIENPLLFSRNNEIEEKLRLTFRSPFLSGIYNISCSTAKIHERKSEYIDLAKGQHVIRFVAMGGTNIYALKVEVRIDEDLNPVLMSKIFGYLSFDRVNVLNLHEENEKESRGRLFRRIENISDNGITEFINKKETDLPHKTPFIQLVDKRGISIDLNKYKREIEKASDLDDLTNKESTILRTANGIVALFEGKPQLTPKEEIKKQEDVVEKASALLYVMHLGNSLVYRNDKKWIELCNEYTKIIKLAKDIDSEDISALKRKLAASHFQASIEYYEKGLKENDKEKIKTAYEHKRSAIDIVLSIPELGYVFDWNNKILEGDLVPRPWQQTVFVEGSEQRLNTAIDKRNSEKVAHLISDESSFVASVAVKIEIAENTLLSWDWKALDLPEKGDVRNAETDDQALQVLVVFLDASGNLKFINYIWDSSDVPIWSSSDKTKKIFYTHEKMLPLAKLEEIDFEDQKLLNNLKFCKALGLENYGIELNYIVVNNGSYQLDKWQSVKRNLYDDYVDVFKDKPTDTHACLVGVQSNTYLTKDRAEGEISKLVFSRRENN